MIIKKINRNATTAYVVAFLTATSTSDTVESLVVLLEFKAIGLVCYTSKLYVFDFSTITCSAGITH